MNKDVIYIDVDDDITAIIGKIKESKEKIVALVPPKHVGVLQSAVNLRLLDRMAKTAKKNLVVVTNNQALIALAASARIPVARNLQSKPELAEIPALAIDEGDDIIDGSDLPVGDHAASTETQPIKEKSSRSSALQQKPTRADAVETLEIEEQPTEPVLGATAVAAARAKKPKGTKIPNFNKFRKRLILAILAGVIVIAGLVWAFVFAPAATVTITADTTPEQVSGTVKLGGTAATDLKAGIISSESQQLEKDATVQFTATGTGKTGDKATGTMKVTRTSVDNAPLDVPAGTTFTAAGLSFVSTQDITLAATTVGHGGLVQDSGTVNVTAGDVGSEYNLSPRAYQPSVSGISAQGGQMNGGNSQNVTIVSDDDIQQAMSQITGQSTDAMKKQLESQFKNGEVIIDGSFTAAQGTPVSSPASGQQVGSDGKATLTVPMTYTVQAFPKTALDSYLTANLTSQITGQKNQRIYDNGDKKIGFSNFTKADDGSMTVNLTTTGQVGPEIDETSVKNSIKGQVTGTVQNTLGNIDGVRNVDVQYSYFWVHKIPNNINKITIEFKLTNG